MLEVVHTRIRSLPRALRLQRERQSDLRQSLVSGSFVDIHNDHCDSSFDPCLGGRMLVSLERVSFDTIPNSLRAGRKKRAFSIAGTDLPLLMLSPNSQCRVKQFRTSGGKGRQAART